MPEIDIYLAGEEHNEIKYQRAAVSAVKSLSDKGRIKGISLELEIEKFQHLLDNYDWKNSEMTFGIYTSLVNISKKRGLDVFASDYRDTLANFVLDKITEIDEAGEPDLNDPKNLNKLLKPLTMEGGFKESLYGDFLDVENDSSNLNDFFLLLSQEERERHITHRLVGYLKKNPDSAVFHLSGIDHISSLSRKLSSQGYNVDIVDLSPIIPGK